MGTDTETFTASNTFRTVGGHTDIDPHPAFFMAKTASGAFIPVNLVAVQGEAVEQPIDGPKRA